jgi:hypothetical protein
VRRDFHRGLLQHQAAKVVIRQIVVGVCKYEHRESGESHDEHLDKFLSHGLPVSSPVNYRGAAPPQERSGGTAERHKSIPKQLVSSQIIAVETRNALSDGASVRLQIPRFNSPHYQLSIPSMSIHILTKKISRAELRTIAQESFEVMVKAVVDVEKGILALGGPGFRRHEHGVRPLLPGGS